ncbi:MAG TPA: hypothetical protein VIX81_12980 [Gammaproteobacteria bacterium]
MNRPPSWKALAALCGLLGSTAVAAERCHVVPQSGAEAALGEVVSGSLLVQFCAACGDRAPVPVHVASVATQPWDGKGVVLEGERFTWAELQQARQARDGRLYRFVVLLTGKDEVGREFLLDALADHYAEPPVAVLLNGQRADLGRLFLQTGDGRWRNLGASAGCRVELPELAWSLPERDPRQERPPLTELLTAIDRRVYDGARFASEWQAASAQPLLAAPDSAADRVGLVAAGAPVAALEVVTRVDPGRVRVLRDHGPFRAGDVLYVLDGLGTGQHRVWHYGRVIEADTRGLAQQQAEGAGGACSGAAGCWGLAETAPSETWWGWVRGSDGTAGWVQQPQQGFAGVLTAARGGTLRRPGG